MRRRFVLLAHYLFLEEVMALPSSPPADPPIKRRGPIGRWFALFGINGTIALACLLAAISGIFWAWQHEEWRSLVSEVGAGLGALLAAVSPLIRDAEAAAK